LKGNKDVYFRKKIHALAISIDGVHIPDSKMAKDLRELIRDVETDPLFNHSTRVYLFGSLTGKRRGLRFDPELLYVGAMFHDIGLTEKYQASQNRFEADSANAAREFLRGYGIREREIETVWDAISLHTTPGIPEHKRAEVALLTSGVEMDVMGIVYEQFTEAQRGRSFGSLSARKFVQERHHRSVLSRDEAPARPHVRHRQ
jgi:HD superfamily phosphodiesterase